MERPLLRTGEVLETVPGMIVTQHSGSGKANQYFLRGFNLDHGTDFATTIAGMPVNNPTHGHGQGYTDLNFLIPEMVDTVTYRKGVYDATHGDFSSAGSADIALAEDRGSNKVVLTGGSNSYGRVAATGTPALGDGNAIYGVEALHSSGPWENDEDFRKLNGVLGWHHGDADIGWSVLGMGYRSTWNSTDQIPDRAVTSGQISDLGAIDPTDGGKSSRLSVSGEFHAGNDEQMTTVSLYAIAYKLNLWSNFTYFLDDPVNGDQFEQVDDRTILGGQVDHRWRTNVGGVLIENQVGIQTRNDLISEVGLRHTRDREVLSTVSDDSVTESSLAGFVTSTQHWTPWLRTTPGLRADLYRFNVTSDQDLNSGTRSTGMVSPKLMTAFGPWSGTELYLSGGYGLHSNDARGTTITVDPADGTTPVDKVDPLVRTKGAEIGARTAPVPGFQSTVSFWVLDIDSELVFSGDAGTTEPNRRLGVEFTNYWAFFDAWSIDADYAWTQARFREDDPVGNYIPGAVEQVLAAGLTYGKPTGLFGAVRLRYFGPRPLIEDNSVRSDPTTLVNAEMGWRWQQVSASLEAFNLFNSKAHDIDYFYESRLAAEPGPVNDIHFHPVEPLAVRGTLAVNF